MIATKPSKALATVALHICYSTLRTHESAIAPSKTQGDRWKDLSVKNHKAASQFPHLTRMP
ncbi:MAG: hypothetical protein F6K00_28275 [Leptolyngbya sp. SIOISBB]|nr:hypothetical protein [Leptolyngbya sp. SIOISBB]